MDTYTPPEMANEVKALTGEMYLQYSGVSFKDLVERPLRIARDFTISYVGKYAFAGCDDLEVVDLPNCRSVDKYAFAGCKNLKEVRLPICKVLENFTFKDCTGLRSITFKRPFCSRIGAWAFCDCTSLSTAYFPACSVIEECAFSGCTNLEQLYLLASSVCVLSGSAFTSTPMETTGSVFVPASLYSSYLVARNWSSIADRIVPYTEGAD